MASASGLPALADLFGSDVPYAEPYWYNGYKSPFYEQKHLDWRAKVRAFMEENVIPNIDDWEQEGVGVPLELLQKAAAAGLYGFQWPEEFGGTPPEGFDAFHDVRAQLAQPLTIHTHKHNQYILT